MTLPLHLRGLQHAIRFAGRDRAAWFDHCRIARIMLPDSDEVDDVIDTEEEEQIKDEIVVHPTRDDWHEQRELRQTNEGILHVRATFFTLRLARASRR